MLTQLLLGSFLTLATILVAAASWGAFASFLGSLEDWAQRPPQRMRLMALLMATLVWTLGMMTVAVWLWAIALYWLGIFVTFEASVYFALVAFTTLGFGDLLLPQDWRLLGGVCAANGLLMFGLLTAILVETLREIARRREKDKP